MKKRILAFALCVVMLFCALPFTAMADTVNVIEDNALLAYLIGEGYDVDNNGAISATEMQEVMIVDINNLGITSLEGMQYAVNLFWLDAGRNNITDISPLTGLPLYIVDLTDNEISGTIDFSELSWAEAANVSIGHNNIESVKNATSLSTATFIDLSYNQLSDIKELVGFSQLETLLVNNNCYSLNPSDADYGCFAQIESENAGMFEFRYKPQLVGEVTEDFVLDITDSGLLEALIANGVDVTVDGKISACELGNVYTGLELGGYGISDISALSYAINATAIDLSENEISSIDALAGLINLKELDVSGNLIEDISALGGLTKLTSLDAAGNDIEDISALAGLTALVSIDLSRNSISDVSALSELTAIKTLKLSDNFISGVAFASSFKNLDLSYNVFTSVADLVGINAETLDITYNNLNASAISVSDFAGVANLVYETQTEYDGSYRDVVTIPDAALREILLNQRFVNTNGDNVITKGELAGFNGTLTLTGTAVTDLTGVRYMTRLDILRIDNTAIVDISEVAGMTRLRIFTAADSEISDLTPVAKLEKLEYITAPGTKVQDISVLADNKLYSLTSINLKGNGIINASALGNIPTLTTITLSDNDIDSVDFVASLNAPKNLYFDNNYLQNIDAIYELSTLEELDVSSNYIDIPKDFKSSMFAANENLVVLRYDNQRRRVLVDIVIEVTGSNFFELSIDGYDYGEQDYYHQTLDAGQTFTVTASPDMGEFLYWKIETGKIVSYEAEYTFIAASSVRLTAVFRQSYSNRNYISFYTASKQELVRQLKSVTVTAEQIEEIIPDAPSMTGHVFMGWSVDGKTAIAADVLADTIVYELQFGDVSLTPVYVLLEDLFTVTVVNGTGGGDFVASTIIEIVADEPAEGMKFAYWIDENGQIVSYNSSYVFVVTSDTTLEAVYVSDDEQVETEALIAITDKSSDPAANKVTFVVTRDIPTKYTIVQTGILLTNDAELGTDVAAFIIDAAGTIKGTAASTENVGTYIASKGKVQAGDTWYARGYVVYLDTNGELVYLYSDIDSITA